MNLQADNWGIIEKAHNFYFVLLLFTFTCVLDILLVRYSENNLLATTWAASGSRPGVILISLVLFGLVVTIGGPALRMLSGVIVAPFLSRFFEVKHKENPDNSRFVCKEKAQKDKRCVTLSSERRSQLDEQIKQRDGELNQWHKTASTSFAAFALAIVCIRTDGTCLNLLSEWDPNFTLIVALAVGLAAGYDLLCGPPVDAFVEFPEHPDALKAKQSQNLSKRYLSINNDQGRQTGY